MATLDNYQTYEEVCNRLDYEKKIHCDCSTGEPAVYVGTYKQYNNGSLYGEWVNLQTFDSHEEFIEFCHLIHFMEDDAELMFQDYMNFPQAWYSESDLDEETFDKIQEYALLDADEQEAFCDYLESIDSDADIDKFRDAYQGEYDSEKDFAEYIANELYSDKLSDEFVANYFDYEKFARDLFYDYHFVNGHVFSA